MKMNRDARKIIESFADALAAAAIYAPADMRQASKRLRTIEFTANADEHKIAVAFADFLDKNAACKERVLRKTYGK